MMLHCFSPVMEIEPAYRLANKPVMMITNAIAMRRWGRVMLILSKKLPNAFCLISLSAARWWAFVR